LGKTPIEVDALRYAHRENALENGLCR